MVYILYCIYNYIIYIYGIYQSPYVGDDWDDQGTRLGSINRPGRPGRSSGVQARPAVLKTLVSEHDIGVFPFNLGGLMVAYI